MLHYFVLPSQCISKQHCLPKRSAARRHTCNCKVNKASLFFLVVCKTAKELKTGPLLLLRAGCCFSRMPVSLTDYTRR